MFSIKRCLMVVGVLFINVSLLTACNTVKGTVTGAAKDVRSTERAVSKTMR